MLCGNGIPANLRRSKIWRLSILHYTAPPPSTHECQPHQHPHYPVPPGQQIALGHYMTSYMTHMGSKCAFIIVMTNCPRNCTMNKISSNFVKKWTKFETKAQKCSKVHFIRAIWCSNREIGRFDEKLGDSWENRESFRYATVLSPHRNMFSFLHRECINLHVGRLCNKMHLHSTLKGVFLC